MIISKNVSVPFCWTWTMSTRIQRTYIFDGIVHLIKYFFDSNGEGGTIHIIGQCTYNRGGGTLFDLVADMERNNTKHETYLIAPCTLHNLQIALRNAVVNVLGECGANDASGYRTNGMNAL